MAQNIGIDLPRNSHIIYLALLTIICEFKLVGLLNYVGNGSRHQSLKRNRFLGIAVNTAEVEETDALDEIEAWLTKVFVTDWEISWSCEIHTLKPLQLFINFLPLNTRPNLILIKCYFLNGLYVGAESSEFLGNCLQVVYVFFEVLRLINVCLFARLASWIYLIK